MSVDKEKMDRLQEAMDRVKDVLDKKIEKPGGPGCVFPHCSCNSPWQKCERERAHS